MLKKLFLLIFIFKLAFSGLSLKAQQLYSSEFNPDSVVQLMQRVNYYFKANAWKQSDRNWIRATYYTGLMAFYQVTHDSFILIQIRDWGQKHGWKTGTEWIYPANRLTCSQTWMELYKIDKNPFMIADTKEFMDKRICWNEDAFDAGWDYVDALYVGAPAYFMMSEITGDPKYKVYAHRIFGEVTDNLFDPKYGLYYRDLKAKDAISENGKPELWSRGNGWAFASIPRILNTLPEADTMRTYYIEIMQKMAESLLQCQGKDGFWRSSLLDSETYPDPESSGTAFFTYGLAWGINNGILDRQKFMPVIERSWKALYHAVDAKGKVCWGQDVARAPENIEKEDSREYVSGAFLLAGSEIIKLFQH